MLAQSIEKRTLTTAQQRFKKKASCNLRKRKRKWKVITRWLLPKVVPTLDSLAWDLLPKDLRLWTSLHNWSQDLAKKSSYKEHRVDALAPYADEGRGKLR